MKLTERSYSAKNLRPRPAIHAEPDGSLLIVSTSWGSSENAQRVNEDIVKYVQAALADVEVTSPFEFLTCLTDETNYLRIATLIANESMYRSDNKSEYAVGVETLILLRRGSMLAFAQVGSPHFLIQREGRHLAPVSVGYDASLEIGGTQEDLAPLPQQLLGVDAALNVRCGDFRIEDSDRLILYAGGFWPESLWSKTMEGADLAQITQKMVQKNPEAPFWLGLVDFQD